MKIIRINLYVNTGKRLESKCTHVSNIFCAADAKWRSIFIIGHHVGQKSHDINSESGTYARVHQCYLQKGSELAQQREGRFISRNIGTSATFENDSVDAGEIIPLKLRQHLLHL